MPKFVFERTVRLMVEAVDSVEAERLAQEWLWRLEMRDFSTVERLVREGAVRPVTPDPTPPPAPHTPLQPETPPQPARGEMGAPPPPQPSPPQPAPNGILAIGKRKWWHLG